MNIVKFPLIKILASTLIPEFTDSELLQVREILNQRYQQEVEIQLSRCEQPAADGAGSGMMYPTIFWYAENANFVITKTGMFRFMARFFYTPHEQYETEIPEFSDIGECVSALIESQSGHHRNVHEIPADNTSRD